MYKIDRCTVNDIPRVDKTVKERKSFKSKWWRIINEFLESDAECIKITPDDISARNASIALSSYLRHHSFPVSYAKRGDSIYIWRKEDDA